MRIWLFSDPHLECCNWRPDARPDFDVLVAVGNIHNLAFLAVEWLQDVSGGKPVAYVPGNHEWYAHRAPMTVEQGTEALYAESKGTNMHVLMDEGGDRRRTLSWQHALDRLRDQGGAEQQKKGGAMAYAAVGMNYHRVIYTGSLGSRMRPAESPEWHRTSWAWLGQELPRKSGGEVGAGSEVGEWTETVVVTHHLLHPRSVAERFRNSPLTPAFALDLVEEGGAARWLHGHTHASVDYVAGRTRVECNPRGYGPAGRFTEHENAVFDPHMVLEVGN